MRQRGLILSLLIALVMLAACGASGTGGGTSGTGGGEQATTAPGGGTQMTPAPGGGEQATTAPGGGEQATTAPGGDTGGGDTSLTAIKERGKLIVGVKYDVPLFGFLNPETNQVEGFDVDMARAVAERIFGDPDAVEFKEAVSRNRIPYLEQGVVDVVFSTMTANEERAQQIDFSDCYYVAGQSLLVPVDSQIASVQDIGDKIIGTVKGSTSEMNIRTAAPDARIELYDTYSEAVQAMQAGRIQAVTTDDIILYGFQKQSPDRFKVVGGQFTQEPYAAGVKKGNTELLNEVNAAIRDLKQGGKWAELYKQWISEQVPEVPPQDWRDVGK